jgi:radical SAM protein with 4Fe4S-binding SPASM domain
MSINDITDFFVQWHLTERCNLRCKHCYQTGGMTNEMSLPEIKETIGEIEDMLNAWSDGYGIGFSRSFNITGGEPFLHEDIFEILEEIRRRGFEVDLLSNGILINREMAKLLSWLGIRGVQVSIEGPEKIHEEIRGRGTFSACLKGVDFLVDAGIKVTLNVTLSQINADYFTDIAELATERGVQRLGFSRLVPSGRGADLLDKMLTKEKIEAIYKAIFSLRTEGLDIVTGDPIASQMSGNGNDRSGPVAFGGCAAGISGFTILPDGTITPCRRLPIAVGNVRKDDLRELWATSEVLQSLRDKSLYKGKCAGCKKWAGCRGCRAIAYAYAQSRGNNDFLAEDPQCFLDIG